VIRPPEAKTAGPDERLNELILGEANRTISQQQTVLDNLRTRSGVLLAAASIATSFLGGVALQGGSLTVIGWTAVGLFVLSTVSVVYILLPRAGWTFSLDADDLIERYVNSERVWALPDVQLDLAGWWERYIADNQRKIDALMYAYQGAALFLMVAILLFLVDIWVRGGSGG
jgi:hypothetical protein